MSGDTSDPRMPADRRRGRLKRIGDACARIALTAFHGVTIGLRDFRRTPPIFVYQMGKVGSMTVHETLRALRLPNPVYHVHFLSAAGIRRAAAFYRGLGLPSMPEHVIISEALLGKLAKTRDVHPKVITLVRDPIARDISGFFQHVESSHPELLSGNGDLGVEHALRIIRELQCVFRNYNEDTDFACSWFDRELKQVLGVDVFEHPFPHETGYLIIRRPEVDVLILRLEDLTRTFSAALEKFLGITGPITRIDRNTALERRVAGAYRCVVDRFRLDPETCSRIYSSRLSRHFYGEEEREALKLRWARIRETVCWSTDSRASRNRP